MNTASAAVSESMRAASSAEKTSPDPITGTLTRSATSSMVDQSACPVYSWLAVRPCTATAATPACSMRAAKSAAVFSPTANPRRIFTVTGTRASRTETSTNDAASSGVFMSADPSPLVMTLRAGHAMLMSMSESLSPTRSWTASTAYANCSGLVPNSCTQICGSSGSGSTSTHVLALLYESPATLTISV